MNGNYEWNKQFTSEQVQARYREANLHRQAKQQEGRMQKDGMFAGLFSSIITWLPKVANLSWTVVARRVGNTLL